MEQNPFTAILEKRMETLISLTNLESIRKVLSSHIAYENLLQELEEFQKFELSQRGEEEEQIRIFYSCVKTSKAYSDLLQILKDTNHENLFKILSNEEKPTYESTTGNSVIVQTSQNFSSDPMVYKMTSEPLGLYLIINNVNFNGATMNRCGAECDKDLVNVLNGMGFKGNYHQDKTVEDMRELLLKFRSEEGLSKVDSCLVVLMSHGEVDTQGNECILGVDSDLLPRSEVIDLFNDECCRLPKEQPRIFIIQACRGRGSIDSEGHVADRCIVADRQNCWRETILLTPCVEGTMANRNKTRGTWFISALIHVLKNFARSDSLEDMATKINDIYNELYMEGNPENNQVQCYIEYGVTKNLYFYPVV